MDTRSAKAPTEKRNYHRTDSSATAEYPLAAFMACEQPLGDAACLPHCAQCQQLWKRTLAALQGRLPAQFFETVSRTLREVCQTDAGHMRGPGSPIEQQQFELVLSHECAAVACTDPNCALCCNSTSRRCSDLLLPKYLVRDPLVPACGAPAAVRIQRRSANDSRDGSLAENDFKQLPEFVLQVLCLLLAHVIDPKDCVELRAVHGYVTHVLPTSATISDGRAGHPRQYITSRELT